MRKALLQRVLFTLAAIVIGDVSFAQVDASSSLILRPVAPSNPQPNLDSGRYTVKPSTESRAKEQSTTSESGSTYQTSPSQRAQTSTSSQIVSPRMQQQSAPIPPSTATTPSQSQSQTLPSDNEDVRVAIDDSRWNLVELSVAPGFLYVDSSSSYWYRKYHSSGPGVSAAAKIWITPNFGLNLNYFTTLAAGLSVSPTSDKEILVDHRFTNAGFLYRRFAGPSKLSPSLLFGLHYSEYQMLAPTNEQNRMRLKSVGPAILFGIRKPHSEWSNSQVGVELLPKLKVTEDNTVTKAQSGTNPSTYAMRVYFGQDYVIDSSNTLFWRLSHRYEQTIYKGEATANDPIRGTKPEGVAVRQQMTLFEMGYSWGE